MFCACPIDGPVSIAAAASKAPPMYLWRITRIPLHCVDDWPRGRLPNLTAGPTPIWASFPCRVISRTGAESRGDDNGRYSTVKLFWREKRQGCSFFLVSIAHKRQAGQAQRERRSYVSRRAAADSEGEEG
jgi:hypothetical protein